jgi:single-strand DNA-binding protein
MNNWNFTGNLGNAAEQKHTSGGDSVVSFSVAVKSGYGDKATTTWARCSMFGKRGESVLPYLNKGQLVGVSGEMTAREWKDKEGQTKTSIEVRVNDLTLLGKSEGNSQQAPQRSAQPASKPTFDDEQIPF